MDMALPLKRLGNISGVRTQITAQMEKAIQAIYAPSTTTIRVPLGSSVRNNNPAISNVRTTTAIPPTNNGRLPSLSINSKANMVNTKLIKPRMVWNCSAFPNCIPACFKISGP